MANRVGTRLTLDLETGVRVSAATREQLVRIVREAVTNAARHGRAETVTVAMTNGNGLTLRIEDDGLGFEPVAVQRQRLRTREHERAGRLLSAASCVWFRHQRTEPRSRSCFHRRLSSERAGRARALFSSLTIIPPREPVFGLALENGGFTVCAEVGDAPAAVEAAVRLRPDICLLDIHMPGSGIAAADEIGATRAGGGGRDAHRLAGRRRPVRRARGGCDRLPAQGHEPASAAGGPSSGPEGGSRPATASRDEGRFRISAAAPPSSRLASRPQAGGSDRSRTRGARDDARRADDCGDGRNDSSSRRSPFARTSRRSCGSCECRIAEPPSSCSAVEKAQRRLGLPTRCVAPSVPRC